MFMRLRSLALAIGLLTPAAAFATPVVSPGGKPGAAVSWSSSGTTVTLRMAPGFDANQVAAAIGKGVQGASAKAEGDKVVVTGIAEAQLLPKLEKVDVAESMDDVDAMLA